MANFKSTTLPMHKKVPSSKRFNSRYSMSTTRCSILEYFVVVMEILMDGASFSELWKTRKYTTMCVLAQHSTITLGPQHLEKHTFEFLAKTILVCCLQHIFNRIEPKSSILVAHSFNNCTSCWSR